MDLVIPPGLGEPREELLDELLPIAWKNHLDPGSTQLPAEFLRAVVRFMVKQDASLELAHPVTWLELVVRFVCEVTLCFRFKEPVTGGFMMRGPCIDSR